MLFKPRSSSESAVATSHTRWVLVALFASGAIIWVFDHHIFLYGALPLLLIFACPLVHLARRLRDRARRNIPYSMEHKGEQRNAACVQSPCTERCREY